MPSREENSGDVPAMDAVAIDDDILIGEEAIDFDAVEHPPELELGSEGNLGEDDSEGSADEASGYEFRFSGEMDPLSFAEDEDASGLKPYERFEWVKNHYAELAATSRPSLRRCESGTPTKRFREEEDAAASFEELMDTMVSRKKKRSRKNQPLHRGRRKGSKNKLNPEVTRKLGDATFHISKDNFEEAISVLKDVIRMAPNLSDPYHLLGRIYVMNGDNKRAMNFYMIAAHLNPKDTALWKVLISESVKQGDKSQANYCLNKAILADPGDTALLNCRASLYLDLREYHKAAETYEQIFNLCPDEIELLTKATQLYKISGQWQRAICMLEGYPKNHDADYLVVLGLLSSILMEHGEYMRALEHIQLAHGALKGIPLHLNMKAGICHAHLGNLENAEDHFKDLKQEDASSHPDVIVDVADALMAVGQFNSSLKYYLMLKEVDDKNHGYLCLKIARCYCSLGERTKAIEYYYAAIQNLDDSIDARLALSSLLLEEDRSNEAISVLSPPTESDSQPATVSDTSKLWWRNGKITLKLSQIYKARGSLEDFVDVLFPIIRDTLHLEVIQQRVKMRKRLSRSVLTERLKVLGDQQADNVFQGFRPVATSADLYKAFRAKKLLEKKAAEKEAKKATALETGFDWDSEDSDDDSPRLSRKSCRPPLSEFLKEEGNHLLILDLCKSLSSLRRYWDALEIINLCLKLECDALPLQTKEDLRNIGAQMAYNVSDPAHGWEYVRYVISHRPYSLSAWNCYYKGILRSNRFLKHNKFLYNMRAKHKDSAPPILISAHQFTMISQHQAAAREYLEAYKLMPDNPLISLCAGTALINLSTSFRLQNKHQTFLQGLAFLYNNLKLCEDSQEALYNIARAYHHVDLVSFAVKYYEKVLALQPPDCPIPTLPNENATPVTKAGSGYCNLRREAAYNLHLIYKNSGATDLARQVLKDHVTL